MNKPSWENDNWTPPDYGGGQLNPFPTAPEYEDTPKMDDEPLGEPEIEEGNFLFSKIGNEVKKMFDGFPSIDFAPARDAFESGQQALQDLYLNLSPLEEYGSAYTGTSGGWNLGVVPFNTLVTGSKGVTLSQGRMYLNDRGLWRLDSQLWVDTWVIDSGAGVSWEMMVYRPDGTPYHRKRGAGHYANSQASLPLASSVVVPEAGYYVEMSVTSIAPGRSILGGEERTHLSAHHINRQGADRPNV